MTLTASLEAAERRLAKLINRTADEQESQRRADDRALVRRDDARCASLAAEFQPDFAAHGLEPPMARADEWSSDYERRLLRGLQRRLPPRSELANPAIIDGAPNGPALENFATSIRAAAAAEADRPSFDNRADSVDDPRARRERLDPETGARTIEWIAKRSFISDIARPGLRVQRITDPVSGRVLMGPQFAKAPGY